MVVIRRHRACRASRRLVLSVCLSVVAASRLPPPARDQAGGTRNPRLCACLKMPLLAAEVEHPLLLPTAAPLRSHNSVIAAVGAP